MEARSIYPVTPENFYNWLKILPFEYIPLAERGYYVLHPARLCGDGQIAIEATCYSRVDKRLIASPAVPVITFDLTALDTRRTEINASCSAPELADCLAGLLAEIAKRWPPEILTIPTAASPRSNAIPPTTPSGRPPNKDYDWAYAEIMHGRKFGEVYAKWSATPAAQDLADPRKSLQNAIRDRKKKGVGSRR